ncbi:MAG: sulfatase-like hydrolase/transferase [Rhodospirillales bacterium]|nr:MAG: sulfatase-like hydrolase/transferase [Rhodospirillales bacterium]
MPATNLVIFMADQHSRKALGCYGHPLARTPHIDALAARGTRFAHAYTNSPLCVPARACFATGRHLHEIGYWDNAIAYDGRVKGWGHRLLEAGREFVSIGKLHYRFADDPIGVGEQLIPMHIARGRGDVLGLIRPDVPERPQSARLAEEVGAGETEYTRYDRDIADHACAWLAGRAKQQADTPWTLFVSFIAPHFPLIVPADYLDLYARDDIPLPKPADRAYFDSHPWWKAFNASYTFDRYFRDDEHRRLAIACYFGLCSFVDAQIGRVMDALAESGLARETTVAYTSDHGENLGARGLWGKSTMYEESAGIPLILAGPDIPEGRTVQTPVSLVDFNPTVLDCAGLETLPGDALLPGRSLRRLAAAPDDPERIILSEYHAAASISAAYMLRRGQYKYIHYTGCAPELFDLSRDPEELENLAAKDELTPVRAALEALLRATLDPEATDRRAKQDQARVLAAHGGREAILKTGGIHGTPPPDGYRS